MWWDRSVLAADAYAKTGECIEAGSGSGLVAQTQASRGQNKQQVQNHQRVSEAVCSEAVWRVVVAESKSGL